VKSRLFSTFDPKAERNKAFLTDINQLIALSAEQRRSAVHATFAAKETKNTKEKDLVIDRAAEALAVDIKDVASAISVITFLLQQIVDPKLAADSPDKWTDDLVSLGIVSADKRKELELFLIYLWEEGKTRFSKAEKRESFQTGVLQKFLGIGHTVDLRAVIENQYRFGDDVSVYSPSITEVVPIISVDLILAHGPQERRIGFQITPEELRQMRDKLSAMLVECERLEKWVADQRG